MKTLPPTESTSRFLHAFSGCFLFLTAAIFVSSCKENSGPIEITEVREFDLKNEFEVPVIYDNDRERMRFISAEKSDQPANTAQAPQWNFTTPEDWKIFPSSQFREINLKFGENNEGECYLSIISGGDSLSNINRWRKQMALPALTPEEAAELPTQALFGRQATSISLDGTFTAMGGSPKENYRMRGLLLSAPGATVTVKLTGPMELVKANEEKFNAFCQSLSFQ